MIIKVIGDLFWYFVTKLSVYMCNEKKDQEVFIHILKVGCLWQVGILLSVFSSIVFAVIHR